MERQEGKQMPDDIVIGAPPTLAGPMNQSSRILRSGNDRCPPAAQASKWEHCCREDI
jgi:hypothetical protein